MSNLPISPARWRTLPVQAIALFTFALMPVWYRVSAATPIIGGGDVTRFAVFIPSALTFLVWVLLGLPGIGRLFSGFRAVWLICLVALAIWAYASGAWAYLGAQKPDLANTAALTWAVSTGFAVAVASVGLPARAVVMVLMLGVAWNGVLVGQQVALQGSAGGFWATLKEFQIDIDQPRISVVQADGIRWLRPYGLLPHPNLLAGFLTIGLLACASFLTDTRPVRWLIGAGIWSIGLWALMLTFSRGAYLAFGVGGLLLLILMYRAGRWTQALAIAGVLTVILGLTFATAYHPFLLARAGNGDETTEQYSLGERAMLNAAAVNGIQDAPILGLGAGNIPWYSARWLYVRDSPIQGNFPHNAALTVWSELGLVGLLLWAGAIGSGIIAAFGVLKQKPPDSVFRAALISGFVALMAAGLVEYYSVTIIHFMAGGWGLIAVALTPINRPMLESGAFNAEPSLEGK